MCSHYQAVVQGRLIARMLGIDLGALGPLPESPVADMWPRYQGSFLRLPTATDPHDEAAPAAEWTSGQWGMVSPLAKTLESKASTFNARWETAGTLFSFRNAWRRGQHCIIPAEVIYEPDWRSGKARPARITRRDGEPMGIAGLWDRWRSPRGDVVHTYTMLTINADTHPLFSQYHRPGKEKRQVLILPRAAYWDWLRAGPAEARDFAHPYPADKLVGITEGAAPEQDSAPPG